MNQSCKWPLKGVIQILPVATQKGRSAIRHQDREMINGGDRIITRRLGKTRLYPHTRVALVVWQFASWFMACLPFPLSTHTGTIPKRNFFLVPSPPPRPRNVFLFVSSRSPSKWGALPALTMTPPLSKLLSFIAHCYERCQHTPRSRLLQVWSKEKPEIL